MENKTLYMVLSSYIMGHRIRKTGKADSEWNIIGDGSKYGTFYLKKLCGEGIL